MLYHWLCEHVVGVSLGETATMRFGRRVDERSERTTVLRVLRPVYHLNGEALDNWEHSIVAMGARRWSITSRNLAS